MRSVRLIPMLLLAGTVACPSWAATAPASASRALSAPSLPAPSGPWRVGRAAYHWIDSTRAEDVTDDPNDRREVLAHIWYPAAARGGERARYLEVDPANSGFQASSAYQAIGLNRLAVLRSNAFANAPIARSHGRFPVILFSHGLGMVSPLYSAFIEDLASRGYVVVGVESAYFSAPFRLSSAQVATNRSRRPPDRPDATPDQQEQLRKIREEEAIVQAHDLAFALDRLERLNAQRAGKFGGRLDLHRTGVFGHSRGGFAALHACSIEPRFRACLNLDGYRLTEAVMRHGVRQPYMHIQEIAPWLPPLTDNQLAEAGLTRAQADEQAKAQENEFLTTFQRMRGGAYVVTVAGAAHMSFTDLPTLAPDRYRTIAIDSTRAIVITRAYVRAFFDRYLGGRKEALLERRSPYPEVTLEIFKSGGVRTLRPAGPR